MLGFVAGWGPFVRTPGELLVALVVAIAVPGIFFLISLPFGAGAIGMGDLKLLFGVGLLAGAERLVATVIIGALVAAVGIIVLLVARRITLKSYVPYGPFLIIGIIWALTVSAGPVARPVLTRDGVGYSAAVAGSRSNVVPNVERRSHPASEPNAQGRPRRRSFAR